MPVASLGELLALPRDRLATLDIALVNLLCAEGLPGAEQLNVAQSLATLDDWARRIKRFTADNRSIYYAKPNDFNHHQGLFKFLLMADFLKLPNGIGVRYQPTAIRSYDFRDSRDDFLHGLLTRRLGTCASLPVLAVAIGRRLGYPIHLATSRGHVFCQWVDDRGRINLEISCPRGGDAAPDEHYESFPRPLSDADRASGRFLRPLSRAEELALFLETRGHCLADNKRFDEAREAYFAANAMVPDFSFREEHLWSLST